MAPWGGSYAKPRSLCGEKNPLPVIRLEFVAAHLAGYGLEVCPECRRLNDMGACA